MAMAAAGAGWFDLAGDAADGNHGQPCPGRVGSATWTVNPLPKCAELCFDVGRGSPTGYVALAYAR